jgi:hypothetical protein
MQRADQGGRRGDIVVRERRYYEQVDRVFRFKIG